MDYKVTKPKTSIKCNNCGHINYVEIPYNVICDCCEEPTRDLVRDILNHRKVRKND